MGKKSFEVLKKEAYRLINIERLTQKEVSARLGIRPNTVNDWVKKYRWLKSHEPELHYRDELTEYLEFTRLNHPQTYSGIIKTFIHFKASKHEKQQGHC